jgi:hypothetical protein
MISDGLINHIVEKTDRGDWSTELPGHPIQTNAPQVVRLL